MAKANLLKKDLIEINQITAENVLINSRVIKNVPKLIRKEKDVLKKDID